MGIAILSHILITRNPSSPLLSFFPWLDLDHTLRELSPAYKICTNFNGTKLKTVVLAERSFLV